HGEGTTASEFIGNLNQTYSSKIGARKSRLAAEKVHSGSIEEILTAKSGLKVQENKWGRNEQRISEGLLTNLGVDLKANPNVTIARIHANAKDNLQTAVTNRKNAYTEFANDFGFSRTNRFEEPKEYTHSDGTTKYRMIDSEGKTRDLNLVEITKYKTLLEARESHENARKNLNDLEQEITGTVFSSHEPKKLQATKLTEAKEALVKSQTEERNKRAELQAFYDKNGVLKTPQEYKAPVKDSPVDETEAKKTAKDDNKQETPEDKNFKEWFGDLHWLGKTALAIPVIGGGLAILGSIFKWIFGNNQQQAQQ
ncbi:MAG: hypothetical protein ACK481_03045, partial [Candidatus Melainabacteria bacterium]